MSTEFFREEQEKEQRERALVEAADQQGHRLAEFFKQNEENETCSNCDGSGLKVFLGPGNIPFYKDCPTCT